MTSNTTAIRTSGRRCVACNQLAEAWLCDTCAFSSGHYSTRFYDDMRSTTATMVARRGLYPGPHDGYRDMPTLHALDASARLTCVRPRIERRDDLTQLQQLKLLQTLKAEAAEYEKLSRVVDANELQRERDETLAPAHWNTVPPMDPRRWCDDCQGRRKHRAGCSWIAMDGPYIGGYPDDGLRPAYVPFKELAQPNKSWKPMHHRQHRRAVARRWRVFLDLWTRMGLDYFARVLEAKGKPPKPPTNPNPPTPKKTKKTKERISKEILEKVEHNEVQP